MFPMVNQDSAMAETIFKNRRKNKTLFKAGLIITEYFTHTSIFNDLFYCLINLINIHITPR